MILERRFFGESEEDEESKYSFNPAKRYEKNKKFYDTLGKVTLGGLALYGAKKAGDHIYKKGHKSGYKSGQASGYKSGMRKGYEYGAEENKGAYTFVGKVSDGVYNSTKTSKGGGLWSRFKDGFRGLRKDKRN